MKYAHGFIAGTILHRVLHAMTVQTLCCWFTRCVNCITYEICESYFFSNYDTKSGNYVMSGGVRLGLSLLLGIKSVAK